MCPSPLPNASHYCLMGNRQWLSKPWVPMEMVGGIEHAKLREGAWREKCMSSPDVRFVAFAVGRLVKRGALWQKNPS